jgi:ATPase family associated with various cellular activities (AAA)
MTVLAPNIRATPALPEVLDRLAEGLALPDGPDWSVLNGSVFDRLGDAFGLSGAQTRLISLLAGSALSGRFAEVVEQRIGAPVIEGWLRLIPGLDWASFAPGSVLRSWSLVQVHRAARLCDCAVSIDARLLDWCLGTPGVDARLLPYRRPTEPAAVLSQGHAVQVLPTARTLAAQAAQGGRACYLIVGEGMATRERVATELAKALDMVPLPLAAPLLEVAAADRALLLRLAARETVLGRMLPVFALLRIGAAEVGALHQIEGIALVLAEAVDARTQLPPGIGVLALEPPDSAARVVLWQRHLPGLGLPDAAGLAEAYAVGADDIARICNGTGGDDPAAVWAEAHRILAPPPDPLVLELRPRAGWGDLVLSPPTEAALRAIAAQTRHRAQVYRAWDFAGRTTRGLGITALFTGPSGTGKTLAAEVIAADLGLRLLRVNLAQVVDKYVGETEKHLDHVFGLAERSGAILLFDEADALFSKRSDGDSGQERFTAMTVAYLLQRLESTPATCILTTNLRGNVDDAFLRRLRFVVQFAFPGLAERQKLWRGAFPDAAPLGRLDLDLLATLPATGGTIRNAALNAAFFAAEAGRPIGMDHILAALEIENAKLVQAIDLGALRRKGGR